MRVSVFCVALIGFLSSSASWSDVRLPSLIGDGMVLQRDARIRVWGWADPGEPVRINFHGVTVKTRADQGGLWTMSMGPFSPGGPYEMAVQGKNSLRLHNILLGDVWLAGGQSNMEFPVQGAWASVSDSSWEVASADFPQIRLFVVKHESAVRPRQDVSSDGWRAVTPQTVREFSAVAYLFGREIHHRYRVPVGLIQSVWGGSVAEAWMSEGALHGFPEFHEAAKALDDVSGPTQNAYSDYVRRKAAWYQQHGAEDRGRVDGRDVWARPDADVSNWSAVTLPLDWLTCGKNLNGFSGVVWFRHIISVPAQAAGRALVLHLGTVGQEGITYFNGEKIGETQKKFFEHMDYVVPGEYVRQGENTIAVRVVGSDQIDLRGSCLMGPETEMRADVGGTSLSLAGLWSYQPGPDLKDFPLVDASVQAAFPSRFSPVGLFNAMLNPLFRFRIKGVIWYQGESNSDRPTQYRALFPALIREWRQEWGYEFPFLFVQLAGFGPELPESAECQWAELREAQSMALSLPMTGMATAVDVGDANDVHPRDKQDVAHRLVLAAAKVGYGESVVYSGPVYQSMQVEGNRIRIKFSQLGSGLVVKDKYGYARGFDIAAADGRFVRAQARRDGQDIMVANENIHQPVAVRYDWSNTPDGNVFNVEGLPATPFRTDGPKK
jgi:sialate O-acetylesterase